MENIENVYTCSCGNFTWIILEKRVRCATCKSEFDVQNTAVKEFNQRVAEEVEELEDAVL